jgi:hypothetical protein
LRKGSSVLLATYVAYVGLFALAPYSFELDGPTSVGEQFQRRFEGLSEVGRIASWDIWTNTLLFVPFGVLFVGHPFMAGRPHWVKVLFAGITSALLSFSLEAAQVFLPRHPSINDVGCNTVGAVVGALLVTTLRQHSPAQPRKAISEWRRERTRTVGLTACLLLVFAVFAVPLPLAMDLEAWGSEIEVFLGSEDKEQTVWRGAIYLVSVYRRELSVEEVFTNFLAGPFLDPGVHRVDDGLVLLHEFSTRVGGTISDPHSTGLPVNLRIRDPTRARWLKPHGLALLGTSLTMSSSPQLRPTGWRFFPHQEFSVEAWVAPADSADFGTVRIVSYSRNPPRESLTLSRYRREFLLKLGPPDSGLLSVSRASSWGTDRQTAQHVVITYRDGVVSSYFNAGETPKNFLRGNQALVDAVLDVVGEQFRWPLCSILLFPLGIGSYLWPSSRLPSMPGKWRTLPMVSALLLLLVLARLLTFKGVEPFLMLVGGVTTLVSVMVAPYLTQYFENE